MAAQLNRSELAEWYVRQLVCEAPEVAEGRNRGSEGGKIEETAL
jgi:hypothetical protein